MLSGVCVSLCRRRRFLLAACDVPPLEDKFNVDEYSDLVTLTKPVIYITIAEIINTHTVSNKQTATEPTGQGADDETHTIQASAY